MKLSHRLAHLARLLAAIAILSGLLPGSTRPAQAAWQQNIAGPTGSGQFGTQVAVLPNGNFVVTDPAFDGGIGADAGAVYLYNGDTGAWISTLTGAAAGDQVGSGGVTVLSNGNFVVSSPDWDDGATADAGAVTWGSATAGVSGAVSAANSLVGSHASDRIGGSGDVLALSNGNYVVSSYNWDRGGIVNAGAVTWGDGATGATVGIITAVNSLVGSTAEDQVGIKVYALSNGNYVVQSPDWDRGAIVDAGAVTWGDGAAGTTNGAITALNSLVGGTANDSVGAAVLTVLSDGDYIVRSVGWDNSGTAATDAGAVSWGSGAGGLHGVLSDANSLVGNKTNDQVGNGLITELTNGNYVAVSYNWSNGAATRAGAATWGNGATGTTGLVTSGNSLVGAHAEDQVGYATVTPLSNGHYVVNSPYWDNVGAANAGAVTWGNGTTGRSGTVTISNSLVGSQAGDQVGMNTIALTNGNYVVRSPYWANGGAARAGAVTWGNGASGTVGVVSPSNSLVGETTNDQVGNQLIALSNGNYVTGSVYWDAGGTVDAGMAAWGNGTGGTVGTVSASNSLVGSHAGDQVGGFIRDLANGNYVVSSPAWDNGGAADAGAATWGNGTGGTVGPLSAANSLVGGTANDRVGITRATALENGNYVVPSYHWTNAGLADAGAVTWGNGTGGTVGLVSAANSLVGGTASDLVGMSGVEVLSDDSYVLMNPNWDNGGTFNSGAVTWGFGPSGVVGLVSSANSVRGTAASGGATMNYGHDPVNEQLVVGRPDDNIVTRFRIVHGVMVFPSSSSVSAAPGAQASHLLQVTNTGDTTDTFDLVALSHDWTTSFPATVGPLAPGASQSVTVNVTVPAAAAGGDEDSVTIVVASQADPTNQDADILTTTASNVYGVTVTPATATKSGQPGATVSYTVAVANTGNTTESFNLAAGSHAWTTSITPATVGPLAAGASQNVTVNVTVPATAAGGATDSVTITAASQADAAKTDTAVLTTTAGNVYGVTVTPPTAAKSGAPGATVSYTVAIANTGNTAASFTLAAGGHSWTTGFPATVGPLAAAASQNVTVTVTVPASAAGGSTDAVTITVTSQSDGTVTDTAVLTTTADNRKIYMPVVRK